MNRIENISNDPNQIINVQLADGSFLKLQLVFMAAISRWVMTAAHPDFPGGTANNINVCVHPNMFRPWREVINFGMACTAIDGVDPVYIDDFSNGRVSLFLLTADDVIAVEENVFGGVLV